MLKPISTTLDLSYQKPPKEIEELIGAPPTPAVRLSPNHDLLLLLERSSMPPIEEVAKEELCLAGIRINPKTNGSSRTSYFTGILFKDIQSGIEKRILDLPIDARINHVSWSPKGDLIAFANTVKDGVELWLLEVETASVQRCTKPILNGSMGGAPFTWFSDGNALIYKSILTARAAVPPISSIPTGPILQISEGDTAPIRTYQDLLKNQYDEALFEYYSSSELMVLEVETRQSASFGISGIINSLSTSPDGNYVLISKIKKPFSYLVPYNRFPFEIDLYDRKGKFIKQIADIPLAENIPQGLGAVRKGARHFSWRADHPAQLCWSEALDEGDPKNEVAFRDQLYLLAAPFDLSPQASIKFPLRFGGIEWCNEEMALCHEWWWQDRREVTSRWNPSDPTQEKETIFDRSWEDRYNSPGQFETHRNAYGRHVLRTGEDENTLYLLGNGASPEGNRPFVDEFDLNTKTSKRLWRSEAPYFESPMLLMKNDSNLVLTSKESKTEPPNFFIRQLQTGDLHQITHFPNPYESIKNVQKETISYQRKDGIELTGTLYLPAHYNAERDGRLPVLMWAYPKEFKSKDAASQVSNSPYEFTRIHWSSPIFWVTQGYAIFDDFSMPIVGEGNQEPNETFIEQLRDSAEAAVSTLVKKGIADPKRIAVGGHSYGAFMTANLLVHNDLFAAGIARSGAYNRTLTPFGFQSEERTFWEAPEIYMKMSPFVHAHKIKTPLLLIHGDADNNSGTFPMQSKRFFSALKGHGATARLVLLPHESHGYQAEESIMHMLWEMTEWLERYVKEKLN